ncbi:caspase activity and apoptosis inhibitor 1-like [Penaeus chinensis]|uniref:caspase activity and apoptosis inhibitor 1-like n=1 Tax=Penaeus chinensis TaxID=139456 RepID=UPI001FB6D62B|nr:caspase activity and apoptosis inhibitor 1-like [Penaeus chinensis]XP_047487648.1 caspase activity and apoptosis inhibitor 1-like [Penaeus chinensis]XP_047487649.1 caspase activity and apoptosis inhibitor 1-like [Penaeus chinensis]XP_047487650.1 caspase activity and apoptosis inhibitor 1-like [Penaeus chinensis]
MITQDTDSHPKLKKMKTKKAKFKKEKKKKMKKGLENPESDSESDNLDLSQPMYPLSHYISDQEDLVNQMFSTIRGSKFQAMLPPVLQVCLSCLVDVKV